MKIGNQHHLVPYPNDHEINRNDYGINGQYPVESHRFSNSSAYPEDFSHQHSRYRRKGQNHQKIRSYTDIIGKRDFIYNNKSRTEAQIFDTQGILIDIYA